MKMACTSSLEDVAARFGLDSSHVNKPCTEAFFLSFSDHVHPWRLVFADLLSQTDLDDVDSEHSGCSEKEKRLASLRKWKSRRGDGATFRAVIEAVLSTGNQGGAEALCQIMAAGRKTELSQDQPLSTCSVNQPSESSLAMTRTNEEKIRAKFIALVQSVQDAIRASNDVEVVRNYLIMFFECDLPDTTEVRKLFEAISLQKLWNYQHHSPLESVANHFLSGNREIERSIREYKAHLSGFYVATKLVDFIQSKKLAVDDDDDEADDQQLPVLSPKQYRRLKVVLKLERKITELSLKYVHELWCSFAEEYDIPSLTIILERVASGSLVITWLVPTHLADKIVPRSKFFRDHGVVQVFLDSQSIYDEEEMAEYEESFLELCRNMTTADIDLFSFFLKERVDPNTFDKLGKHPLFYATYCGRQDLVELLIEHGADVDLDTKEENGDTPLITAVCSENYQMVELLLLKGAKVNKTNKEGLPPLWFASRGGHSDIVSLLLQHRAEVDLHTDDELGDTPLHAACEMGHLDVAAVLVQNGAVVNYDNKEGSTPLYYASQDGHIELVDLLLSYGADINKGVLPPLYGASQGGHVDIAKFLVSRSARIDQRTDDEYGTTPLMIACQDNHLEVVSFLIENGANVNLQSKDVGYTPLHAACQKGHTAVVKLLLKSGALIEIKGKYGRPPLMLASWMGELEIVIELLRAGARANTQDRIGLTSLMLASQKGHAKVVEALLEAKADPDIAENTAGWSAVFFAAKSDHLEIVQRLLNQGARVDIRDKNGLTSDEVTSQQNIREAIKRYSLNRSETEATEEQEMIEVVIQDQHKEKEEEERRGLVRESYRRLLQIFDILENGLLPGRKEKKLHQQRKKMHSNIHEADQELTSKD